MKIVNFDEFVELPAGTIYSDYEPAVCTGLFRKGDSIRGRDFYLSSLVADCWNGDLPTCDVIESRWALYEYDAEFAVYEDDDVVNLLQMLVSKGDIV